MQGRLFESSRGHRIDVVTPRDNGSVSVFPSAIPAARAEAQFRSLLGEIDWEQRSIFVYGKRHNQPRLVAWHGDHGKTYRYSGDTLIAKPWTEPLVELRVACETLAEHTFNSVLLNLYRDGNDAMGWHTDNEPELGNNPVIASLSLGETRRFDLKHKLTGEKRSVHLGNGDLLVMSGDTQVHWVHQVPRSAKVSAPRINLTFRTIL